MVSKAPWKAEGYKNAVVNDAEGNTLALFPGGGTAETATANAALIAAAPELLDALKSLHSILIQFVAYQEGEWCARAVAAIRKAEGNG
jgi:hypothetical protein